MSSAPVAVPESVLRKVRALGPPGERWLEDLPRRIDELEREWNIRVGPAIAGGTGAYVAEAVTADGVETVLKLAIPEGLDQHAFAAELSALRLGAGRGYVRVIAADAGRDAMLQERLGRSLGELGLPVETQIDIIVTTLKSGWHRPADPSLLTTGAEQAHALGIDIVAKWEALGHPLPRATIDQAVGYAQDRYDAFDNATAVFIHGDAHPANILESVPGGGPGGAFKLVDPDAMLSEPAHDLAIPLRDWSRELLAGEPVGLGLEWCERLSARTGVASRAIWQWAFLERVSTGLYMLWLGDPYGELLLRVASLWTGSEPDAPPVRSPA